MKYNTLGSTDMKLSHLSLGGTSFSNIYRKFDQANGIKLIQECLKNGINYVDAAPWYGQGTSEITCGQALKGVDRNSYYMGCKVGRYELDVVNMFDFSAEKCHASVELSLQRLGIDYVDIIQVHDLTFAPDISIIMRETLPALVKEVERGHARYIGLCDYDLSLMKDVIEETEVKISSILSYAKSTMIDNRLQKYVDFFERNRVGVINAAGNAMGLLSSHGPQSWHPASDDIKLICKNAADYCKENGVEIARLAQWFTFKQPKIATHVIGLQEISHLHEAVNVLENGLTQKELDIFKIVQERFFKNETYHWDNVELPKYRAKLEEALNKKSVV